MYQTPVLHFLIRYLMILLQLIDLYCYPFETCIYLIWIEAFLALIHNSALILLLYTIVSTAQPAALMAIYWTDIYILRPCCCSCKRLHSYYKRSLIKPARGDWHDGSKIPILTQRLILHFQNRDLWFTIYQIIPSCFLAFFPDYLYSLFDSFNCVYMHNNIICNQLPQHCS